jgi:hypothetical protein
MVVHKHIFVVQLVSKTDCCASLQHVYQQHAFVILKYCSNHISTRPYDLETS